MWLLDVNLPNGLVSLLTKFGIKSDTSVNRGWKEFSNGELSQRAHSEGFNVIMTRDQLFGESASKTLKKFPDLCILILKIP